MIVPISNINLATNVRDTLLTGGGSVNNDVISFFKEGAKINPWNKYKPTDVGGDFPEYPGTYWKGKDGDCMMVVKTVSNLTALENLYLTGDTGWVYKTFDASKSTPYRLGDFRGYDTNASSCISSIQYSEIIEVTTSGTNNVWLTPLYKSQNNHELNLSDIWNKTTYSYMDGWYVGFVYKSTRSSELKIITQSNPIDYEDINETILFPVDASYRGTFTLYPVLSQHSYTTETNVLHPSSYICPLPNSTRIDIEIKIIVPYTINLDKTATQITIIAQQIKPTIVYNIKATQGVKISGDWYYTAIDEDGMPLGETIKDPNNGSAHYIDIVPSEGYSETFIGTTMYLPGINNAEFAGVRVEFRSEIDGASFGGNIFNLQ